MGSLHKRKAEIGRQQRVCSYILYAPQATKRRSYRGVSVLITRLTPCDTFLASFDLHVGRHNLRHCIYKPGIFLRQFFEIEHLFGVSLRLGSDALYQSKIEHQISATTSRYTVSRRRAQYRLSKHSTCSLDLRTCRISLRYAFCKVN